jgi:hypothetical protein
VSSDHDTYWRKTEDCDDELLEQACRNGMEEIDELMGNEKSRVTTGMFTRRAHEAPGVDRLREFRRIEVAARHPGMRTGSCSMPRTNEE